jgi:hypothetical protein
MTPLYLAVDGGTHLCQSLRPAFVPQETGYLIEIRMRERTLWAEQNSIDGF